MKLTEIRKSKLILAKILEYAEIGGMEKEHCGIALEAVSNCLHESKADMAELNQQIQQILKSEIF